MTNPSQDAPGEGAQPHEANAKSNPAQSTSPSRKGVWMGTAVGIGSAAIVAALLYANKKRG